MYTYVLLRQLQPSTQTLTQTCNCQNAQMRSRRPAVIRFHSASVSALTQLTTPSSERNRTIQFPAACRRSFHIRWPARRQWDLL